jgi:Zinc-binding loop region of homing endonuclease
MSRKVADSLDRKVADSLEKEMKKMQSEYKKKVNKRKRAYRDRLATVSFQDVPRYGGIVTCKEPLVQGNVTKGTDGSISTSINSEKVALPKLVYCATNDIVPPSVKSGDCIYHLCDYTNCCKLSHLAKGSNGDRNSRIRCPGLLKYKGHRMLVVGCEHEPICRKITFMGEDETIEIEEYEVIDPNDVDK